MENTVLIYWIVGLVVFVCATIIGIGKIISQAYGNNS